ncbi:MAG: hypothetical protein FWG68_10640 [Defluviitaleaceae bacterium]|nr:hypothetical protein [Defluviitaleaceae bacterium]
MVSTFLALAKSFVNDANAVIVGVVALISILTTFVATTERYFLAKHTGIPFNLFAFDISNTTKSLLETSFTLIFGLLIPILTLRFMLDNGFNAGSVVLSLLVLIVSVGYVSMTSYIATRIERFRLAKGKNGIVKARAVYVIAVIVSLMYLFYVVVRISEVEEYDYSTMVLTIFVSMISIYLTSVFATVIFGLIRVITADKSEVLLVTIEEERYWVVARHKDKLWLLIACDILDETRYLFPKTLKIAINTQKVVHYEKGEFTIKSIENLELQGLQSVIFKEKNKS